MGRAMIKIRYRDSNELSPGLHAAAERHGRSTTVYLLSGLTAGERRAALRRLRLSAAVVTTPAAPAPSAAGANPAPSSSSSSSSGGSGGGVCVDVGPLGICLDV